MGSQKVLRNSWVVPLQERGEIVSESSRGVKAESGVLLLKDSAAFAHGGRRGGKCRNLKEQVSATYLKVMGGMGISRPRGFL